MPTHFSRLIFRTLILIVLLWVAQPPADPVFAQASASMMPPAKPLPLNQLVSGQFRGKGEVVTYSLDIPPDQDVVVEYRANKLVFYTHCIFTDESPLDDDHCSKTGGSGDDRPVSSFDLIPTSGQSAQHATINLYRVLDGASTYQVIAYTVTSQTIVLGNEVVANAAETSAHHFQTFTMEADPSTPFTVDAEDESNDGNFLWVTYQPFTDKTFPNVETTTRLLPQYVDGAYGPNGVVGVQVLQVFHLGQHKFRILIQSAQPFKLRSAPSILPTLSENQTITTTVSYRHPVVVVPLNAQPERQTQINFRITRGKGAIVRVYEVGDLVDVGLSLGWSGSGIDLFDLSGSVQRTPVKALYAVVQIPYDYTREAVSVVVSWQHLRS